MKIYINQFLATWLFLGSLAAQGQTGAVQSFKGDRTLSYHDLYIFPHKGLKVEAFWLIAPPYLETAGDLDHSLFNLQRKGMTSEVLRSHPLPEPPDLTPNRNNHQKVMNLQLAATAGLRELITQRSEYGAALAEQLTVFNSKPSRLSDLKQKAQRMALSFPPYKKIGTVLPTLPSEDKIYKDVATVDASRDRALSEKTHALDRSLKSSILANNADQYAMTMSRLFALQDLGQEAAQKSAKIVQGYHAYGILKGFSIDRLTDRLFPAAFLENHSGFDLIGLNKIILLADGRNDQESIVALLFLVRSSLAAKSEDTRLLPDSLYQRLKRQDNLLSIISDLTPLGEFGHTEKQVREEIARAIQIWKGDSR